MQAGSVFVRIDADTAPLQRGLRQADASVQGFERRLDRVTGAVSRVEGALAAAGVTISGGLLLQGLVRVNRESESLQAQLKVLEGATGGAKRAFSQLTDFATRTPFQLNEVTEAYIRLRAAGLQPTNEMLTAFGDLASSRGKNIVQFAEAVEDALTGEFERLKEFGVTARQSGDQVAVTFNGQTEVIDRTRQAVTGYLQEIGESQGVQGSMAGQMETLTGVVSNAEDAFGGLARTVGEGGLNRELKEVIGSLTETANRLAENRVQVASYTRTALDATKAIGAGAAAAGTAYLAVALASAAKEQYKHAAAALANTQAERQLAVQATFTGKAAAAAAVQIAAAKEEETAATLANLQATRAAILLSREEALAELTRARAIQAAAAAVPISQIAPLGGAAVERELARRAAATAAVSRATKELAIVGAQEARVSALLAETESAATAATTARTTAEVRLTAAEQAQAAAAAGATRGAIALAGAETLAGKAMGLLLGPWGIAITVGLSVASMFYHTGSAARSAADDLDTYKNSLLGLNRAQLESKRDVLADQIRQKERELRNTSPTTTASLSTEAGEALYRTANPVYTKLSQELAILKAESSALGDALGESTGQAFSASLIGKSREELEALRASLTSQAAGIRSSFREVGAGAPDTLKSLNDQLQTLQGQLGEVDRALSGGGGGGLGGSVTDTTNRLRGLQSQLRTLEQIRPLGITELSKAPQDLQDAVEAADGYRERLQSLQDTIKELQAAKVPIPAGTAALTEILSAQLEKAEEQIHQRVDRYLHEMERLRRGMEGVTATLAPPIGFDRLEDRLAVRAAERERERQARTARGTALGMVLDTQDGHQSAYREARAKADAVKKASLEQFNSTIEAVGHVSSAFGELAGVLGDVDGKVGSALRGVESLVNGIGRIKAGHDQGGVLGSLGMVSGGIGVAVGVAQLIGGYLNRDDALNQERNNILRENQKTLVGMRADMQSLGTGGAISKAGPFVAKLADILAPGGTGLNALGPAAVGDAFSGAYLTDPRLKALEETYGLSFQQLAKIAKDAGIELLDSTGRAIPEAFNQLVDALGYTVDSITRFQDNLADAQKRQSYRNEIFDVEDTPAQQLKDSYGILEKIDPELLKHTGIANLNLDSKTGRSVLEEGLRHIFEMIDSGQLTADQLGGFTDKNQLLDAIVGADKALDAFSDTANTAASAMQNVPQGFKVTLARFQAAMGEGPSSVAAGGGGAASVAAGLQTFARDTDPSVPASIHIGDVTIQAAPGDDEQELWNKFKRVLIRKTRAVGGDAYRFALGLPA